MGDKIILIDNGQLTIDNVGPVGIFGEDMDDFVAL